MKKEVISKLKNILIKQDKQKKRGLNNYNILTAVRNINAEVGMHSNFIYSLLNPNGDHYQNTLFAKIFIEKVLKLSDFGEKINVKAEEQTKNRRRIDFTIKGDRYFIGIEMKIDASDLDNQIYDYHHDLLNQAAADKNQEVFIYYLTKDGKDASKSSCEGVEYKRISFETDILDWLNACQIEVGNITNLNYAIESYKDVIKMITNKYKTPIDSFTSYFMQDKDFFTTFKNNRQEILKDSFFSEENIEKINKGFETAKRSLIDNFFKSLFEEVINENQELYYFRFDSDIVGYAYIIRFILQDKSQIRLYVKNNTITSIGVHPWLDNKLSDDEKNSIKSKFKDYLIGKKKGVALEEKFKFEIDDELLFKNKKINLTQTIRKEISIHIKNIMKFT